MVEGTLAEDRSKRETMGFPGRRGFVRGLVSLAALGGIGALLFGRQVEKVSAVGGSGAPGRVAFWVSTSDLGSDSQLFWDNANKWLGVGTVAPARSIHLQGSNACFRMDRNMNSSAFILVRTDPINFNTIWKTFYVGVDADGVNNGLLFIGDRGTDVAGPSEKRLVIDNAGNVGIGTTAPPQKLHVAGDVGQTTSANGLVKAAVVVNAGAPSIVRSFNNLPGGIAPTVSRPATFGPGTYEVNFGVDVSQRFFQATLISSNASIPGGAADGQILVSPRDGNSNAVFVRTNDSTGTNTDRSFCLLVY